MVCLFIFKSKHFFRVMSAWAVYSNIHAKFRNTSKLLKRRELCEVCAHEESKMFQGILQARIKCGIESFSMIMCFSFSFLLGSLRLAKEPNLCSSQELLYPCFLQGLGETSSNLLDEKQRYNLFFQSFFFFLRDIFRALERKELASPLFIFLTGAVGQS